MAGYVYIVTNHKKGTLYIGVTSDLEGRNYEHREGLTPGFASRYGCTRLVWYEQHERIGDAIQREKSLKRWYRQWSEERPAMPVKRQRFGVSSDERPEP